jgi:hypothetical protein
LNGLIYGDVVMVGFHAETSEKGQDGGASKSRPERVKHGGELKVRHCVGIVGIVLCEILTPETLSQGVVRLVFGSDG